MVVSILLAMAALRTGLTMRRARLRKLRRERGVRERHLRLAKTAVGMVVAGFGAGLASAAWLRGWEIFATAHSLVSSLALLLFLATAWLGRQLEQGRSRRLDLHALIALAATGTAAAATITGFILLP